VLATLVSLAILVGANRQQLLAGGLALAGGALIYAVHGAINRQNGR